MPLPSEEQLLLRDMARGWAQKNSPVKAFRTMRDSGNELGFEPQTLAAVAEMGWTGTVIPESYGGSDVGYWSMGIILEELGRTLAAAPLIGSAVGAATVLKRAGSEAQKSAWLPRIADGSAIGALAIDETNHFAPERIRLEAVEQAGGFVLSGRKNLVHEGMAADFFVVAARTRGELTDSEGISLLLVPSDRAGLTRSRRRLLDSRGYADLVVNGVEVANEDVIGSLHEGRPVLDRALDCAAGAAAAEALGLAIQAFETTLEYLKVRVQFGQVIGTFQALQHRAAKLYTDIQLARPALETALDALDQDSPEAPVLVSLAKATINDLVNHSSREMIQLHGGIGMTDAHDAGFYLKRARVLESAFGTSAYHRERFARLNGF